MPNEPNLSTSMGVNPAVGGATNLGSRTYDYTATYRQDKPGTEGKGNARVWSVYLDEADNLDTDILQGYRNIIDSLLIFAALFSGVVTTFVVQTSTALHSDNGQIMAALLYENNQLLWAAGNGTNANDVPFATLAPGSTTHSSTDVWINGLFFASLALALSTALLTVLAKQWIQAYTSIIPGDGKTRALIRHFRFLGIQTWPFGGIIEALPLILHGSVAIFMIGLALHVSQFSPPLCGIVASVTIITFMFYFVTSLLPAIRIDCPYRVPSIFPLAQLVVFAFRAAWWSSFQLLKALGLASVPHVDWPAIPRDSDLKTVERKAVFPHEEPNDEVVAEGIAGLLSKWELHFASLPFDAPLPSDTPTVTYFDELLNHDIFPPIILIALEKIARQPTLKGDNSQQKVWSEMIDILSRASRYVAFDVLVGGNFAVQHQIYDRLKMAYVAADRRGDRILSEDLLRLGGRKILQANLEGTLLHKVAYQGSKEGIRSILKRRYSIIHARVEGGWSALHWAAMGGNLDTAVTCIEQDPTLLNLKSYSFETALDVALRFHHTNVVKFLLDRGAEKSPYTLHRAVDAKDKELVKILLDYGCDPAEKDEDGRTSIDIANNLNLLGAAEFLTLLQRHMLSRDMN
ncbi:hypothetical protein DXG01_001577 [Tephrocybe rancida]|nr:hypothetical protein DXG01_001577 [Tephrocybe rancida]